MNQKPTPEEAMRVAELFLNTAIEHNKNGTDKAIDLIDEFYTYEDPALVSRRIWAWASVGPVIAAAGIKKLNIPPPGDGELWGIENVPGPKEKPDPSLLAALQAVVGHLNDDPALAMDVMSAHYKVAGHEGLISMTFELIALCSFLVKEGAFK